METSITVDLAGSEDLRAVLGAIEFSHQDVVHVRSGSHRAEEVCAVLRSLGLFRFERTQDTARGCRVTARALKAKRPPPPSFVGPVGVK